MVRGAAREHCGSPSYVTWLVNVRQLALLGPVISKDEAVAMRQFRCQVGFTRRVLPAPCL